MSKRLNTSSMNQRYKLLLIGEKVFVDSAF
jgi:hypothetical protein